MAAVDNFSSNAEGMNAPADDLEEVTPHDTNELTYVSRALYVGTGGTTLTVVSSKGVTVAFANVPNGTLLPIRVKQVKATGTDATGIVALS